MEQVFETKLTRVALEVPMRHRLDEVKGSLKVVTTPIEANLKGKTFFTSKAKRIRLEDIMKLKVDGELLLPLYYVICYAGEEQEAAEMIRTALGKWLAPVAHYMSVVSAVVEKPMLIQTRREFMDELMSNQKG